MSSENVREREIINRRCVPDVRTREGVNGEADWRLLIARPLANVRARVRCERVLLEGFEAACTREEKGESWDYDCITSLAEARRGVLYTEQVRYARFERVRVRARACVCVYRPARRRLVIGS